MGELDDDVTLAEACARGDTAALARLEAGALREVKEALLRSGSTPTAVDEAIQGLRKALLAPRQDAAPGISLYLGRGSLVGWLRVAAMRELARVEMKARREVRLDTGELAAVVDSDSDAETRYLKQKYSAAFKSAFGDALKTLTDRQRRLLRWQVIERLSIDEIGQLCRTHRATAARWLVDARSALSDATRAQLRRQLGVDTGEVESVMRLVESQIDVSVERLLE